ncbi:hypothetical protein A3A36_00405 [Candidatus Kaiserbacteria bacterium RIFCSPLOWO2_01_FULL_52_12b]|uniref:Uncharacterized protein n=1 Tax=Candidatus Kaiserbacteria bacterium RIFCSPLOWO2_01_FULL_52_12b TaxID=1798509 RepID=A0A1F6EXU0_9BACT|nr:MAG: hypothetical protein A3A36_00405 [Candidatus Kaiserbacteria bacterium RIFCSPLOWO2_01_FULL_52_12b]
MHHKGNGYNPADVVAEAVRKFGQPVEKFFFCAKVFGNASRFDASVEAKKFKVLQDNSATNPEQIPPLVIAFANWVLVKELKDIQARYH